MVEKKKEKQVKTKQDTVKYISEQIGLPNSNVADIVNTVINHIKDGLKTDGNVKIPSFGSFYKKHKKERIGRNPKTGEEHIISARDVCTFRASKKLKDHIREEE